MFAEASGALTTVGAVAGIVATIGGIGLAYGSYRLKLRTDKANNDASITTSSIAVAQAGITWSETQNVRLRVDLTAAETEIEQLKRDVLIKGERISVLEHTLEENEAHCRTRLAVLELKIQQLTGAAPNE